MDKKELFRKGDQCCIRKVIYREGCWIKAFIYYNDNLVAEEWFGRTMLLLEPTQKTYNKAHNWANKVIELFSKNCCNTEFNGLIE